MEVSSILPEWYSVQLVMLNKRLQKSSFVKTFTLVLLVFFMGAQPLCANSNDILPELVPEPTDQNGRELFSSSFMECGERDDWYSFPAKIAGVEPTIDFDPQSNMVSLGSDKIAFCFSDVMSVWSVVEGRELWQYRRPLKPFASRNFDDGWQIAADPRGKFLYATRNQGERLLGQDDHENSYSDFETSRGIAVWDVGSGEGRHTVVVDTATGEYLYQTFGERCAFARGGRLLVGFEDGCVSLADSADGRVCAKILRPLVPGAAILFSSQRRLSASDSFLDKARKYVASSSDRTEAVEAFFDRNNQPAQVYADLNGVRPGSIHNIDENYRIPSTSIVSAVAQSGKVRVKFEAKSDVRWKLAEISVCVVESAEIGDRWRLSDSPRLKSNFEGVIDLPLPPGNRFVTVEVKATDQFGGESVSERLRIDVEQNGMILGNRLLAVSIGVGDYEINDFDLKYANSDATEIAKQLRRLEGVAFGTVVTEVLVDEKARIPEIRKAFQWLGTTCRNNDVVVIFISGHGLRGRRGLYYLPYEGDPESIQSTCLNWDELAGLIGKLSAQTIICLTDVCHAGAIGESSLEMQADSVNTLQGKKNLIIGSSSRAGQFSLELDSLKHGAFASSLLEALQGKADSNGDGSISAGELDAYCRERVKTTTEGRQEPTFVYDVLLESSPLIVGLQHLAKRAVLKSESQLMIGNERTAVAPLGSTFVDEKQQGSWSLGVVELKGVKTKGWIKTSELE